MGNWIADAHFAARRLRMRPGYALLAVLTLALGVGGTAAVFGMARRLLVDPLPFANEREVGVFWKKTDWTEEEFLFLRGRTPGFRDVALYRFRDVLLREGDSPARLIPGITASAELFEVLGARSQVGRSFAPGDDVEGAERVAVLSYGLWQELGGDESVVGTRLLLDGRPSTVIGVMPSGFWFPDPSVRIWTAAQLSAEARSWNSTLIGRVAPGQNIRVLAAPLAQLVAMLDERFDYPAQWDKTRGAQITPVRDDIVGGMRPSLLATLGAMALILLIACANVAALMLGQVDERSGELAMRLALGASRSVLTRQLAIEALVVAVASGILGAAFAWSSFRVLAAALPLGAWAGATSPDWTVFASAMAIALTAALITVIVPAVSLVRGDLRVALTGGRTGRVEGRGGRLESGLVIAEVALAVLIAAGAALLARSVAKLYAVDPGVRTEGVGVIDVTLPRNVPFARQRQTLGRLTEALSAMPGARTAASAQVLPLRGGGYNLPVSVEGRTEPQTMTTEYRVVTPGYLEIMGIELRDGRTITAADRSDTERIVVINEVLARQHFPSLDPIGQRVEVAGGFARVVGVVLNAVERQLTGVAEPVRYVPLSQMPWVDEIQTLVFQAAPGADAAALLDAARRTVERVAPEAGVRQLTTMLRVRDVAVGPARQVMSLLSLLAGLALTLGAVGVYGVMAHFAMRRRRELAIRLALGLTGPRVVLRVVSYAALLLAAGIGFGMLTASGLSRLLASFLYGVSTLDLLAFAAAGIVLLIVGLIAALVPAIRAGMTDPAIILREY